MTPAGDDGLTGLLAEQVEYYRAVAVEYDDHALPFAGGVELREALEAFRPRPAACSSSPAVRAPGPPGCGPGSWTTRLLRHAAKVTALDASTEMLDLASARVAGSPRVEFVLADLFDWRPDRRYDVVFFGFWLSHVPPERSRRSGRWSPTV
jgi:23S rRNA C2498 (ribose-2'-O)-methylase RlmM